MKILVTVRGKDISPRFDLTMEVLISSLENDELVTPFRTILLPRPSVEELCSFIIKENINTVICGGIEERHLEYLEWKKIIVFDSVIGPFEEALDLLEDNRLQSGCILAGAVNK